MRYEVEITFELYFPGAAPNQFNNAQLAAEHRVVPSFGMTAPLPISPPLTAPLPISPPLQLPHRPTIVLPGSRPVRPFTAISGFDIPPPPPAPLPSDIDFAGELGAPKLPANVVPDDTDLPSTLPNLQ